MSVVLHASITQKLLPNIAKHEQLFKRNQIELKTNNPLPSIKLMFVKFSHHVNMYVSIITYIHDTWAVRNDESRAAKRTC